MDGIYTVFNYILQTDFKSTISFIADLTILFITVFMAWLTLKSKNIRYLGYKVNHTLFFGSELTLFLDNRTLHTIVIRDAYIIIKNGKDDYRSIIINGIKSPIIVEARSVCQLSTGKVTDIGGEKKLEKYLHNSVLFLNTTDGPVILDLEGKAEYKSGIKYFKAKRKKALYNPISIFRLKHGEEVLSDIVKYAMHIYSDDGKLYRTIYVSKNGMLSQNFYGSKTIPKEFVVDGESLVKYLNSNYGKINCKVVTVQM